MTEQVVLRLDDHLAADARRAVVQARASLEDGALRTLRHQLELATAQRARREEDTRGGLYTPEHEDALLRERMARGIAAFEADHQTGL